MIAALIDTERKWSGMRLIDADALIDSMDGEFADSIEEFRAITMVNDAPTIEPKRGEWIEKEECWQCSECGDEYVLEVGVKPIDARMHYCPNCGADMRERSGE